MSNLVPICKVPALIESWYGWRPHEMTIYRWMQGVHGGAHKLKTIKRGSRRLTSRGELRRFMREWSGEETVAEKQPAKERQTKEHDRAVAELRKMGMNI